MQAVHRLAGLLVVLGAVGCRQEHEPQDEFLLADVIPEVIASLERTPPFHRGPEWPVLMSQMDKVLARLEGGEIITSPEIVYAVAGDGYPARDILDLRICVLVPRVLDRGGLALSWYDGEIVRDLGEIAVAPIAFRRCYVCVNPGLSGKPLERLLAWLGGSTKPDWPFLRASSREALTQARVQLRRNGRVLHELAVTTAWGPPLGERARGQIHEVFDPLIDVSKFRATFDFAGSTHFRDLACWAIAGEPQLAERVAGALSAAASDEWAIASGLPHGIVAVAGRLPGSAAQVTFFWLEGGFAVSGFYLDGPDGIRHTFPSSIRWRATSEVDPMRQGLLRAKALILVAEERALNPARLPPYCELDGVITGDLDLDSIAGAGLVLEDGDHLPAAALTIVELDQR